MLSQAARETNLNKFTVHNMASDWLRVHFVLFLAPPDEHMIYEPTRVL